MKMRTDRSIWKYILLCIVTCGIYDLVFIHSIARDTNEICKKDGQHTGGLCKFILLTILTCGIYSWVWYYKLGNRLAKNGRRYRCDIEEDGTSVLLWMTIGLLLCGIGYFIGLDILIQNLNELSEGYNRRSKFFGL